MAEACRAEGDRDRDLDASLALSEMANVTLSGLLDFPVSASNISCSKSVELIVRHCAVHHRTALECE